MLIYFHFDGNRQTHTYTHKERHIVTKVSQVSDYDVKCTCMYSTHARTPAMFNQQSRISGSFNNILQHNENISLSVDRFVYVMLLNGFNVYEYGPVWCMVRTIPFQNAIFRPFTQMSSSHGHRLVWWCVCAYVYAVYLYSRWKMHTGRRARHTRTAPH